MFLCSFYFFNQETSHQKNKTQNRGMSGYMGPTCPRIIHTSMKHKSDSPTSRSHHNNLKIHQGLGSCNSSASLQDSNWITSNNNNGGSSSSDAEYLMKPSGSSEFMSSPPSDLSSCLSAVGGDPSTTSATSFSPSESSGNGSLTSPEYFCYNLSGKRPGRLFVLFVVSFNE